MVGNGQRVRFWKDRWCGDSPFCVAFPTLFAISTSKDVWVKNVWSFIEGEGSWSPPFSKPFNDWEMDGANSFLLGLNGKSV